MRPQKVIISLGILLIIGLHGVPVVYGAHRKQLWPFLDWSMYKESHAPGPIRAYKKRLVGVRSDGGRSILTTDSIGLNTFALNAHFLFPLRDGDTAAGRALLARINARRQAPFAELRWESDAYTATGTGVVMEPQPPIVIRTDSSPTPAR